MLDHKEFLIESEHLRELRAKKDKLEEEVKELNKAIDVKVKDLVDYMDATDQLSVKVNGFGTIIRTSTKRYSVDKEDPRSPQAFEDWMREHGDWDLVNAVHPSKLQGYYKERLELNEELPPGVTSYIKNNITIRGN